jgi:uncharacterized protein YqgC (DUF456 family)
MNIFELLTVLGVLAAGFFCGKYAGSHFGAVGWIVGSVIGCLMAIAVYCGLRKLIR